MIEFSSLTREQIGRVTAPIDNDTYRVARQIVDDVASNGESAVRNYSQQLDDMPADAPLLIPCQQLVRCLGQIDSETRKLLERTRDRIERFAQAQRKSFLDCEITIPGGKAGHRWIPLEVAGCYSPGGRYPLPSSVMMTAVTARVAGVKEVWVASPNPNDVVLAAAAVAGADGVLAVGGAHAIASMAFGLAGVMPKSDVIVGPGNRFVTAAKALVSRFTRIDMLAGPSELVVVASSDANPTLVAADLLAQAEHDPDARPILITNDLELVRYVKAELSKQLSDLPTSNVAETALASGGYFVVGDLEEAIACCRDIAPEHLSLQGAEFEENAERFEMGAALFVGSNAAEALGDYGAGPNHVLPTGGAARAHSALSVATFMRFQTQLRIDDLSAASQLKSDAVAMGRIEGLEAHARSAALRLCGTKNYQRT